MGFTTFRVKWVSSNKPRCKIYVNRE